MGNRQTNKISESGQCIDSTAYLQTVCAGSAAGEIPFSGKFSLGLIPSKWPTGSQALPEPTDKEVPASFDWMGNQYILSGKGSGTLPIQQGQCNSCFIVAPSTCLGDRVAIKLTKKGHNVNKPIVGGAVAALSCACNFNTIGSNQMCGGTKGGDMLQSSEWLVNNSIPTNKCYPYPSLNNGQPPQLSCLSSFDKCACDKVDKSEASIKLKAASKDGQALQRSLTQTEIKGLQQDIQANGPVTFGINAQNPSLQEHTTSNPDEPYGGGTTGGHAVVITGWDNTKKAWRVRNSWGEGQNFWLSYDAYIIEIAIVTADISDDNLVRALKTAGYIGGSSPSPTPTPTPNISPDISPTLPDISPTLPNILPTPPPPPPPSPHTPQKKKTTEWSWVVGMGTLILVVGGISALYIHKKTKKRKRKRKRR